MRAILERKKGRVALVIVLAAMALWWLAVGGFNRADAQYDGPVVSSGGVSPSTDLEINSLGVGMAANGNAGQVALYENTTVPSTPTDAAIIYYNGTRIRFLDELGHKGRLWIYDLYVDSDVEISGYIRGGGGSPLALQYWVRDNTVANDAIVTSNTTLTKRNHFVRIDASGGSLTITLPNAGIVSGQEYIFKVLTSPGSNTITIAGNGNTIDGSTNYTGLTAQYQSVSMVYDSAQSAWWIH